MKNLIHLITIGLFVLTSCSVDEPIDIMQKSNTESPFVFLEIDGSRSLDPLQGRNNQKKYAEPAYLQNKTEGYYDPQTKDGITIQWTGTQSEDGIYGVIEMKQDSPKSKFHYLISVECIETNDHEAVFGGTITKARGFYPGTYIGEGWQVYFKVFDNGLGLGTHDKISNTILFAGFNSQTLCNMYPPHHNIWSVNGYSDVQLPGFVIVENSNIAYNNN